MSSVQGDKMAAITKHELHYYKKMVAEAKTQQDRSEFYRLREEANKAREFYRHTAHCPKCWRSVNLNNSEMSSGTLYLFGHVIVPTRPVDQRCRQCRGTWFRWS